MQLIQNSKFDEYVESYKKLSLNDKRNIIEEEIKELIGIFEKLNEEINPNLQVPYNKEVLDTKKDNYTEDDFAESIFVYINMLKECMAEYFMNIKR